MEENKYKGVTLELISERPKGVIGGPCFTYEASTHVLCETCGKPTTRIINFLGKLEAQCFPLCGMNIMNKEEYENFISELPEL